MGKKRLAKSVSLMLCAAMTVTMGSVPALAEELGGDSYEVAFSDDADNFENPAETGQGIEEDSEAEKSFLLNLPISSTSILSKHL